MPGARDIEGSDVGAVIVRPKSGGLVVALAKALRRASVAWGKASELQAVTFGALYASLQLFQAAMPR